MLVVMETVSLLLNSKPRSMVLHGREYLVAPLTMIVPGVLPGSQGPLYYSDREVAKSAPDWNGMPIVVEHPVRNGMPVSGRDPEVFQEQGIGHVYRSRFKGGALRAEGYFDVQAVANYDKRLPADQQMLPRLRAGKPIELSTGLSLKQQPVENGRCPKTKRPYTANTTDYKPDHLAVLPGATGACSLKDGCGVHVGNTGETSMSVQGIKAAGQTGPEGKQKKKLLATEADSAEALTHIDASKLRSKNTVIPVKNNTCIFCGVENCKGTGKPGPCKSKLSEAAHAASVAAGGSRSSDSAMAMLAAGDRKEAATNHGYAYEFHKAQAAKTTGEQKKAHTKAAAAHYKALSKLVRNTNQQGATDMTKDEAVQYLVANCDCVKSDEDKAELEGLTDNMLAVMVRNLHDRLEAEVTLNTIKEEFGLASTVTNAQMTGALKKKVKKGSSSDKEMYDSPEGCTTNEEATVNSKSMAEWEATMPAEAKAIWNKAKADVAKARENKITRIVNANASTEAGRAELRKVYNELTEEQLDTVVNNLPKPQARPVNNNQSSGFNDTSSQEFFSAAGGRQQVNNEDEDDVLPLPTYNWASKEAK